MAENKDGWAKNVDVLKVQGRAWKAEMKKISGEIVDAAKDKDIPEVLHKFHAYIEETIDQMPRLWSYLFWPVVAYHVYLHYDEAGWPQWVTSLSQQLPF